MKHIPAVLILTVLLACTPKHDYQVFSGYAQGGTWTVKADIAEASADAGEIQNAIEAILDSIDISLSGYNRNSLLSRRNAGEDIVEDRHLRRIEALSDKYYEMTDGAFDVASAPIFDIWGFGFTTDSLPPQELIDEALEECKQRKKMNFNAIAQGYSCDVIAGYLYSKGIKNMLVDIGEIYCDGVNASGKGWSIGIDTPIDGNNTPGADLSGIWRSDGSRCGVVTSGNYRKFYIRDGHKYAHTIDPRTGYPVEHNLLSATVLAPDAAEADALATALMVMGTEKAIDFVLAHDGIEALLISADSTWRSPGFVLERQ